MERFGIFFTLHLLLPDILLRWTAHLDAASRAFHKSIADLALSCNGSPLDGAENDMGCLKAEGPIVDKERQNNVIITVRWCYVRWCM